MMGGFFWAVVVMVIILYLMIRILGILRRSQNRDSYRSRLLDERGRNLDR